MLTAVSLVLVGGAVVCLWWVYSRPPAQRSDLIGLGGFALGLVGVLVQVVSELRHLRRPALPRSVDTLAGMLARAVHGQWRTAATERVLLTPAPIPVRWSLSSLPVTGELTAALDGPFPPLPGLVSATEEQLLAGGRRGELFAVYGGIASGRVVVVGEPGAGKSGAAVLLVLDALAHRDSLDDTQRARVPVPVLFTAHGWDPTICSVQDWLSARLAADYPLFQHRGGQEEAKALVNDGRIALILDGLDEMDAAARPAALQALSDAPFRVVVLSRSDEMVQATGAAWLVGAVALHLHDVTGPEAADYLQRARTGPTPSGWERLLSKLREDPGNVLTNPLALTLIRDTYRAGDDISPLLDTTQYRSRNVIDQHLIARVLPDAYTPRPGRPKPRYSLTQAEQALTFIAGQMNEDHTRDLALWHIPQWASTTPRILVSMLAGALLGGLIGTLAFGLAFGLRFGFHPGLNFALMGFGFGVGVGIPFGLAYGSGGREPKRVKNWRAISVRRILTAGLAYGIGVGIVGFFVAFLLVAVILSSIDPDINPDVAVPMLGLVFGLMVGLPFGLKRDLVSGLAEGASNPHRPKSWRQGLVVGLTFGLAAGLASGFLVDLLIFALIVGFAVTLMVGFVHWLAGRIVVGLVAGFEEGEHSPQGPRESWRNDRMFGLVVGLTFGLAMGIGVLLAFSLVELVGSGETLSVFVIAWTGVGSGLAVGLVYGVTSSVSWPTTIAWLQLQRSRHVPAVGLMPFLDDARTRGVLRAVGAGYQFRHATLQDHLAGQATSSPMASSVASRPA
ncbi:MAG TPA: hypothetical protein VJT72_23845 [Pseudonocardiaceae bacterium]|nr:hypothetical protein [Pseudonocardiaceae bacterium]